MKKNILVIGSSNIDMIAKVSHLPKPGETIGNGEFMQAFGGKGANQAIAANRLGGEVTFVTALGNDNYAEILTQHFKHEGMETKHIIITPEKPTGTALIMVSSNAENCIAVSPGSNGQLTPTHIDHIEEVIAQSDILVLQAEIPYDTIYQSALIASKHDTKVFFNPAPACKIDSTLMKLIDVLIVNETEAEMISGLSFASSGVKAIALALQKQGADQVIITLGKKGVYALVGKNEYEVDAFTVDAVDTTAAGDTFCGALATQYAERGIDSDSLRFACAASAISVTRFGAQPSIPQLCEVEQFISSRSKNPIKTKMAKTALFSLLGGIMLTLYSCGTANKPANNEAQHTNNVIFETDMGNDIDDALALDMLYKFADNKKINLIAIASNKRSEYSSRYISLLNNWYGYSDIPVGYLKGGIDPETLAVNYAQKVFELQDSTGKALFTLAPEVLEKRRPATEVYRSVLAQQRDSSVIIISVGHSTNLADLLASPRDSVSPLTGAELVARKVKLLSLMGGHFQENRFAEYNIQKDIPAAQAVFSQWPSAIVVSPFEVGIQINYPAKSITNDFEWGTPHPMVEAYKTYLPMPYDRPCWDLTSVLYALEPNENYFSTSEKGTIHIDNEGKSFFTPDAQGKHQYYVVDSIQAKHTLNRLIEVITKKPKSKS